MNLVITGTSTGIGRALAERWLARGDHIWGLARSDQSDFVTRYDGSFQATRCDVTEWPQVARAASAIAAAWPHIDALVTCAGLHGAIGRTVTADPSRWSAAIRTNLDGTFHALRAFHPLLARAPRRAKIVCFSGGGATSARPNFSAYAAAKTGVVRLIETVAAEERDRPLDINVIAPGAIDTRLTDEILSLGSDVVGPAEYIAAQSLKASDGSSLVKALDLVEWLLSPESDGISGRLLSAQWDSWSALAKHKGRLAPSDIYTLRRIVPEDRGLNPGDFL